MSYKVVNNILDFMYWINVIDSIYSFRKVKFSDLFEVIEGEKIQEDSNKISNEIANSTILHTKTVDDILKSIPDDEYGRKIWDEAIKKAGPIIQKIEQHQKISNEKIEWTEQNVGDLKAIKIANDIEVRLFSNQNNDYIEKIKKTFKVIWNTPVSWYLETLFKYKDSTDLTRYDIWVIAWSINSFFSFYFQSLFTEISKNTEFIYDDDLESEAGFALSKIRKNQTMELYDMFSFVNRVQENSRTEIITKLNSQSDKNKYNFLKSFLDSESDWWVSSSHFYKISLQNLRKFRNFHAHHNDERSIAKLIARGNPEKFKIKFYNKFLWDLDEDWTWFLQFIMDKI